MLLTTFQQCRGVNSCFGLCLRLISINIHAEGKFSSNRPGLLLTNPVSRTDAAVTKAPNSYSLVSHENYGKHGSASQNTLDPVTFYGVLLLLRNSLNPSK